MRISFACTHLATWYFPCILHREGDLNCGLVQPNCSGRPIGKSSWFPSCPIGFKGSSLIVVVVKYGSGKVRVREDSITETKPEFETRLDLGGIEMTVIDIEALNVRYVENRVRVITAISS